MTIPEDLLYTKEHEWVKVENGLATVGITDYAQSELGDIVFVELPEVGQTTTYMDPFGTIEAVKAVSELFSPVNGRVVEVNTNLDEHPEVVNQDPYGEGWMIKVKVEGEEDLKDLLSADEYKKIVG